MQYEDLPIEIRNNILLYANNTNNLLSADGDLREMYSDEYNQNILLEQTSKYIDTEVEKGKTVLNDLKHGQWDTFEDGIKLKIEIYKLGKLHGISTYFYLDAHIYKTKTYYNGISEGLLVKYYRNDNVSSKCTKVNGLIHGPVYEYYNSGSINRIMGYKNGIAEGIVINYNTRGVPVITSTMKNGLTEGTFTQYNNSGQIDYITTYCDGVEQGTRYSHDFIWTQYVNGVKDLHRTLLGYEI